MDQPEAQGSRASALDTRDLEQLTALAAAALRDVAGRSEAEVQEWMGPPAIDSDRRRGIMAGVPSERHQGDTRATRRQVARGRQLWVALGAWPWWAIADMGLELKGGMPRDWHLLPRVVDTYRTWHKLRPDGSLRHGN